MSIKIFKLIKNDYVEGRPNVLVLNAKRYKHEKYEENKGFYITVIKNISKQANIFTLIPTSNIDNYDNVSENVLLMLNDPKQFKEKSSSKTANDDNYKMTIEALKEVDFPKFDTVILPQFTQVFQNIRIPAEENAELNSLGYTFIDYIFNDDNLKIVQKYIHILNDNFYHLISFRFCSIHKQMLILILIKYLSDNDLIDKIISFVVDPSLNTHFIKCNKKYKNYYFTDDNRGTRKFEKYDFAQIQHIVYDTTYYRKQVNSKSKNILFVGNLFVNWKHRKDAFEDCFKNLKLNKCDFYIPTNLPINKKYLNLDKVVEDLKNDQKYHFDGWLPGEKILPLLDNYKYALCLNCITNFDSLNMRPVLYVIHDVLPLLQDYYDPEGLWIPLKLQEKIRFKNSDDIERIVKYFNAHEDERLELLSKLKKLFKIDLYQNDFENTFTKEIQRIFPWYKYEPIETIYDVKTESDTENGLEEW